MIEHIILDYDTVPEMLSYNNLIRYKGTKKFSNVKSIEAKVNTEELTLSFLGPMFPNLERLRLNNSVISSIRDIGCNFPKLRFLSLAQCNITSLDGIATISPNLQELYLAGNKIPDLVDLMGMDQLKIIDLEDNGISNFSTIEILKFCDKLTSLTLKSNPIAIDPNYRQKISQLLPKLSYLDETRPQISLPIKPPPPINSNKQTTQPKIDPNKPNQQQTKTAVQQKNQKTEKSPQNKQNTQPNQQNKQSNQRPNNPSNISEKLVLNNSQNAQAQNRKRPPSADNVKRAIQSSQPDSSTGIKVRRKVEMPNTPPAQQQQGQHSPRKVKPPPSPDDAKKGGKLTERGARGGASSSRFSRPQTKLVVSKTDSLTKSDAQTVSPSDIFASPTSPASPASPSPRAKQASSRYANQKDSQFADVKKQFNRTSGAPSSRKSAKGGAKNDEEVMTDMVHDMVERNSGDSKQNRSCLYERSAFPELNSLVTKKQPNKTGKPPEIIKPLSARGPVYI